ncbi:hypothetical protein [Phenylobacterium sp. Root700]|uniref:hypothetical protein n=1 Tax=Phenylobacterium sp. Root700 TaxID=1736591 RepID=UPI0006F85E8F|nr:hypothetical protein [Phenylobacterium sp. Root700]KRB44425.1 hypothetical protein ASE02_01935 [Phenylobacterium sp. Root700]
MIGAVLLGLLAAGPAGLARWLTFNRAAHAGRFDDPIGAIFAVWLAVPTAPPDARASQHPFRRSFT